MPFTDRILAELRMLNPPSGFTRRILSETGPEVRIALSHLERRGHIRKLPGRTNNACRYELMPEPEITPVTEPYQPLRPLPKDGQPVFIKTTSMTDVRAVYSIYSGFTTNRTVPATDAVIGWRPMARFS